MKKVIVLTVAMVFGLALFSGTAALAGETPGEYLDDTTIHTQIDAVVVNDPDTHYFKLDVAVTQGDVVLTGFVNSIKTEERLIAKIKAIRGVKSVTSHLKVEENK